ncbi:MAG: acetyltransferase [Gammaproteobacteria bacterium]|nr:acetyltransferase [Gammaproteobacteria bacterium]
MSKGLLIVGAGGHGKVVADAAILLGRWQRIAFADRSPASARLLGLEVIVADEPTTALRDQFDDAVVAIGDPNRRLDLLDRLTEMAFALPVIAHPSAIVSAHAEIGPGSVIFANGVINPGAVLGRGCIVNTAASVDHDCLLADGVHIAPGAHVAGGVRIGRGSWIGVGASVREYVSIGAGVTVGAGAAVIGNIGDNLTVAGVPATPDFRTRS